MIGHAELREKIGQMLLIGFRGCDIKDEDPIARDLAERNLGGVVLFDQEMSDTSRPLRNIESPGQVRALSRSVRNYARTAPFIAIDQEGGRVNRLKPVYGFPESISHEELGVLNDPAQTFSHAERTARTLAAVGINLNIAPVVDLDSMPDNPIIKGKNRSFSADPEIVTRHAAAFIKAHSLHGVMTCPKHFPGHGSAREDTHLGVVDVTSTWSDRELIPYERLIEAGLCDAVMTAHIFNGNHDPKHPATLSRAVLGGLLRRRLNFNGVVFSDDVEMKAISNHYGLQEAIALGIEAGIDVICLGNNMTFDLNIGEKASEIIYQLVDSGRIAESRIDESFQRVQTFKQKFTVI